jgi:uncharacterized glyoxalase superfamily protein PhnB
LAVFSVGSAHKHIAWIEKTLGGKSEMVMNDPSDKNKVMHAAVQVNGGPIYLSDRMGHYGSPDADEAPSRGTHLYLGFDKLAEAEATWLNALKSKGKVHMPFEAQFWGSHYGVVEDPFGTVWAISAPTPNPDEEAAAATAEPLAQQRKSPRTKSSKEKPQLKKAKAKH